jgi:hypothetical protein
LLMLLAVMFVGRVCDVTILLVLLMNGFCYWGFFWKGIRVLWVYLAAAVNEFPPPYSLNLDSIYNQKLGLGLPFEVWENWSFHVWKVECNFGEEDKNWDLKEWMKRDSVCNFLFLFSDFF